MTRRPPAWFVSSGSRSDVAGSGVTPARASNATSGQRVTATLDRRFTPPERGAVDGIVGHHSIRACSSASRLGASRAAPLRARYGRANVGRCRTTDPAPGRPDTRPSWWVARWSVAGIDDRRSTRNTTSAAARHFEHDPNRPRLRTEVGCGRLRQRRQPAAGLRGVQPRQGTGPQAELIANSGNAGNSPPSGGADRAPCTAATGAAEYSECRLTGGADGSDSENPDRMCRQPPEPETT